MKFELPKTINLYAFLRRAQYQPHPLGDSYIRPVGREFYPRFHLYITDGGDHYVCNLHLDQKKVSYAGHTAHSGDYDTEAIHEEMNYILSMLGNKAV